MPTHLMADRKTAMLAEERSRTQVLRMALAAYKNEAIAKGLGPQGTIEADALAVFKRLVKSREDSVAQFLEGGSDGPGRPGADRRSKTPKPYLPAMIEGPALEAAVKAAIAQTGATAKKDLGLVMKALQAAHGGAIDGKAASALVQGLLG